MVGGYAATGTYSVGQTLGNGDGTRQAGTYALLSQQSSRDALTQFGQVLTNLISSLGKIGANDSRLQTFNSILQTSRGNYLQAASQIFDLDVAQESAQSTRLSILKQAGAAVLTQANQQPALAL